MENNAKNVVILHDDSEISVDTLLQLAMQHWEMTEAVVIGLDANGELVWGSTSPLKRDVNYLLDLAKENLFRGC